MSSKPPPPEAAKLQNAILSYIETVKKHQQAMKVDDNEFDPTTFRLPGQTVHEGIILPEFVNGTTVKMFQSLKPRDGDIIVASYPKTGSMWVVELLWLALHAGDTELARKIPNVLRCPLAEREDGMVPSLEIVAKMPSPRIMKTHLPANFLPDEFNKVIYVMRNPKDTLVSCYHFYKEMPEFSFNRPWGDFFRLFLADNLHYGNYFDHLLSYWQFKDDPRFLFVKYEDLVKDKASELLRVEKFCGRPLTEEAVGRICQATTMAAMKQNPQTNFSVLLNNPAIQTEVPEFRDWAFYRKGIVGDWKNHFSDEEDKIMEKTVVERLGDSELDFEYQ